MVGGVLDVPERCGVKRIVCLFLRQHGFAGAAKPGAVGCHRFQPADIQLQGERSDHHAIFQHRRQQKRGRPISGRCVQREAAEVGLQGLHGEFETLRQLGVAVGAVPEVGAQILLLSQRKHHVAGRIQQQQIVKAFGSVDLHQGIAQRAGNGLIGGGVQSIRAKDAAQCGNPVADQVLSAEQPGVRQALGHVAVDLFNFLVRDDGHVRQHGFAQRAFERGLVKRSQTGQWQHRHQQVAQQQAGGDVEPAHGVAPGNSVSCRCHSKRER